jgi:hypothetical protein
LLQTRQRRFQDILVANPRQASMLSNLVSVNGVNDEAREPARLGSAFGHDSLRQFAKGVAVLLGSLRRHLQRPFGVRVIRRQQDSAVGFDPRTRSPASSRSRSAMSLGKVALTDPSA